MSKPTERDETAVRFWAKVDKSESGCWNWTGSRGDSGRGYGQVSIHRKLVGAHRVSLQLSGVEIPDGCMVLHRCDNPACVNPEHLFFGDQRANMEDAVKKSRHGNQQLTSADVIAMRSMSAAGKRNCELAREFGINTSHIARILSRKAWRHV